MAGLTSLDSIRNFNWESWWVCDQRRNKMKMAVPFLYLVNMLMASENKVRKIRSVGKVKEKLPHHQAQAVF